MTDNLDKKEDQKILDYQKYISKEFEKAFIKSKVEEISELDPTGYPLSYLIENILDTPYLVNDERQLRISNEIADTLTALYRYSLMFKFYLESNRINDEDLKLTILEIIARLDSAVYMLSNKYKTVVKSVLNLRQNIPNIPSQPQNAPNQQQTQTQ